MTKSHAALDVSRRAFLAGSSLAGLGLLGRSHAYHALAQTPVAVTTQPELVIDLSGDPESIDPAVAYAPRDWSVVHAVYDALVGIGDDGSIQPLAAERFEVVDEVTWKATLRRGMTFHDGSPVTANAITRGVDHLQQSSSAVIDLFKPITQVEVVDDLTALIVVEAPTPWLPAQLAVWHVLLPEGVTSDSAATTPVGSGPYRFVSWDRGSQIELERFVAYHPSDIKGAPLADRVVFRFVPEAATRIADLSTSAAHLVAEIPQDQASAVEDAGAAFVSAAIVGSSWIRIATDAEPFSDVRVRQALNLALDVEAIAQSLVAPDAHRLASIHPDDRSMGFDRNLAPYDYDPDRAKSLLAEAGYEGGFEAVLEMTTAASQAIAEAMVAQWADVGINISIQATEYAAFNATWADAAAPPLRLSTWSPLYDPHTLLSLVYASEGFLSRYDNPDVDALITQAASEPNAEARAAQYRDLAGIMHEDAAAIYLWNLVEGYGVDDAASAWQPRGDEYVLPLSRS